VPNSVLGGSTDEMDKLTNVTMNTFITSNRCDHVSAVFDDFMVL